VFVKNFVDHHSNTAKHIASAIDGTIHEKFKDEDDIESNEYKHYYSFLADVIRSEENITYLYTLNYDFESKKLLYAIDSYPIDADTIWIESNYFGLEAFLENGKLIVKYDSIKFSDTFKVDHLGEQFNFSIKNLPDKSMLYINKENILTVNKGDVVKWDIPEGSIEPGDEISIEKNINRKNLEVNYYYSVKGELSCIPGVEFEEDEKTIKLIEDCILNGKEFIMSESQKNAYGRFLSVIAPIKNSDGKYSGAVILDVSVHSINKYKHSLFIMFFIIFLIVLIISLAVSFIFAKYITKPIEDLQKTVYKIANGNFKTRVEIKRNDEIGNLGNSFNLMTGYIDNLTSANSRFVPKEILKQLNRQNIVDIKLGDNAYKKMTIMFSDIRNFTSMSEKMSPQENFSFLNSYLNRMGPIIRRNSGFIDKYIGDCIMALFPEDALSAVTSAVMMKQVLKEYNEHRSKMNYTEIKIGIGLHTGNLMIGIIGELERYEGTVISDAVNLASRIEGLSKIYKYGIIVSESVIKNLPPNSVFNYRNIDLVRVKGKKEAVNIYEIFDGDPSPVVEMKLSTREKLEEAIKLFRVKDFKGAHAIFKNLKSITLDDTIVKIYLDRCSKLMISGVGPEWDSAFSMS
ncbi:MAG: HAMP domain-containing protein, partial [Acidobacteria bacterium]|nr:HAMP domain-containing protein [Acidobacteriota bacterium]